MSFVCGLDIGQRQDYTAFVVVEVNKTIYTDIKGTSINIDCLDVREVFRFELGSKYTYITGEVCSAMSGLDYNPNDKPILLVDATNNMPIIEMIRQNNSQFGYFSLIPVMITGGGSSNYDKGVFTVPKIELIQRTQIALEQKKLRFSKDMPYLDILLDEFDNYQVKTSDSNTDIYNARSGQHDDLVLALSLAVWKCTKDGYYEFHPNFKEYMVKEQLPWLK